MTGPLPILLERYVAVPFCAILAVIAIHASWTNLRIQRDWRRSAGVVTGTADARSIEVSLGALDSPVRVQVPAHPGNLYRNWDHVTVLENPANPEERRILHWTSIADYWRKPLRCALAIGLVMAGVWLLRRSSDRYPLTWRGGEWRVHATGSRAQPSVVMGYASSAWKAHWFWGLVFGLPMSTAIFSTEEDLGGTLLGGAGLLLLGVIVWSAVEAKTARIVADDEGILWRSHWRDRRAPWSEIRELRRVDAVQQIDKKLEAAMPGRRHDRAVKGIGASYQWRIIVDGGVAISMALPDACEPPESLGRLLSFAASRGVKINRSGEPL